MGLLDDVFKGAMNMATGNPLGAAMNLVQGLEGVFGGPDQSSQTRSQGLSNLAQEYGVQQGVMGQLQNANPQQMMHLLKHLEHKLEQMQQQQGMPFDMDNDQDDNQATTPGMQNAAGVLQQLLQEVANPNGTAVA